MLLFGPPENKLELLRGRTPCSFPFLDRPTADAHFGLWASTLARWQGVPDPRARHAGPVAVKKFGGFRLQQYRRPIRLEVPSDLDAFDWAHSCFWDRRLWPMQPAGFEAGGDIAQDHWDIKLNLWSIFNDAKHRLGFEGYGIGGVDISLTDADAVQPDFFVFQGEKSEHLIGNQYFRGVPHLVVEVLSPFSRAIDRGPRKEVYRRAGVPHLWLIEPLTRMVEIYQLDRGEYQVGRTGGVSDGFPLPGFDGVTVAGAKLFETQSSRHARPRRARAERSPPAWGIPRDRELGLQHLILLGHTERRREIWNNRSPCALAFGSSEEAEHRLRKFVSEAARWEDTAMPSPVRVEPDVEAADIGRFHFVRQGHIVRLNVDVDGRLYRDLLEVTAKREAWDWGDATIQRNNDN
jgi:hypothetical protein